MWPHIKSRKVYVTTNLFLVNVNSSVILHASFDASWFSNPFNKCLQMRVRERERERERGRETETEKDRRREKEREGGRQRNRQWKRKDYTLHAQFYFLCKAHLDFLLRFQLLCRGLKLFLSTEQHRTWTNAMNLSMVMCQSADHSFHVRIRVNVIFIIVSSLHSHIGAPNQEWSWSNTINHNRNVTMYVGVGY